mmetsp:Transcript_123174/g.349032  ORF Transcript_123174/g.349032 Transcript_123174/m.349032 type:complete len:395 (-) Transcript_123174:193-1377(-)
MQASRGGDHGSRGPHGHVHEDRAHGLRVVGGPAGAIGRVVGLQAEVPVVAARLVQAQVHAGGVPALPLPRRGPGAADLLEAEGQAVGGLRHDVDLDAGAALLVGAGPLPGALPAGRRDHVCQAQDRGVARVPDLDRQHLPAAEVSDHPLLPGLVPAGADEEQVQPAQVREHAEEGGRDDGEPRDVHAAAEHFPGGEAEQLHEAGVEPDEPLEAPAEAPADEAVVENVVVGVLGLWHGLEALLEPALQGGERVGRVDRLRLRLPGLLRVQPQQVREEGEGRRAVAVPVLEDRVDVPLHLLGREGPRHGGGVGARRGAAGVLEHGDHAHLEEAPVGCLLAEQLAADPERALVVRRRLPPVLAAFHGHIPYRGKAELDGGVPRRAGQDPATRPGPVH